MKLFDRMKEQRAFKQAYRTANIDERKEMVQEYIIENSEDRFIRKMETKYNSWLRI